MITNFSSFTYTYLILASTTRPNPWDDFERNMLHVRDGWSFAHLGEGRWMAKRPGGHRILEAAEVAVVGVGPSEVC